MARQIASYTMLWTSNLLSESQTVSQEDSSQISSAGNSEMQVANWLTLVRERCVSKTGF